jgi:hypothetical protein
LDLGGSANRSPQLIGNHHNIRIDSIFF